MDGDGWIGLATAQEGLISWAQLRALGVSRSFVRSQLHARRWQQVTRRAFCTTTGPLSPGQQLWLGVLHPGGDALIGGLTALKIAGLRGWDREKVSVLVHNQDSFEDVPGFDFFRSRRPIDGFAGTGDLPVCRVEPAALIFAGYERNQRTAHGLLAACVQQRLTTPRALAEWVDRLRPLRRARQFRALISDLDCGVHSLAERDVRKACRLFRVAQPVSQRRRRDRSGRVRFTDCEWKLPDGRTLILEVDGAFHDDVLQAMDDRARDRKLTNERTVVIHCSAYEIRYLPESVMEDLIALGVPRG